MKKLVEDIVKLLVDKPNEVKVNEIAGEQAVVLELSVSKEDLGKVIGKRGHTAQAIRTILNAAGMKAKKRYLLQIIE
jgi:predicted RNA-binding protein YlqC (UPF0109 family)